jgi:hypothetical protein
MEDEKWIGLAFSQFFGDKKPEEVTPMDFAKAAARAQATQPDCEHWTFGKWVSQSASSTHLPTLNTNMPILFHPPIA